MELNELCEKIIKDASAQASEITQSADKKALELIAAADKKNNEKADALKSKASLKAKDVYDRMISSAKLENSRNLLHAKRELIEEAFQKALLKLENLSLEEYKAFITEKIKDINEPAELAVNKKYDKDIDDEFIKSVNKNITKSKFAVQSGFKITMASSCLNYDFKELTEELKTEKDSEVSSLLFS